jgi:hypothetical protein
MGMSQKCVELLLGRVLTDEDFRRSFFPVRDFSFAMAAAHGLELTAIEKSALSSLKGRRFDFIAQTLDPRIARSGVSVFQGEGCAKPRKASGGDVS